jgi:hypothetical protein
MITGDGREWKKETCCAEPTHWDKELMLDLPTINIVPDIIMFISYR